ncbi:unnamed protein product [Heligmosomoides polygyrus]|uniref:Uncharacterized protein n=1 Tax=Heligmosomoides polygyrus TaxID=6339 RepID=A0A3P8BGL1_HELPZ|nr:unnamed protein product [Heligmosomoides polygyrus]
MAIRNRLVSVGGQLAAVYSNASRSKDCSNWSSWGPCVWPDESSAEAVPYLQQITPVCRKHWFYMFVKRYNTALNNFYDYIKFVLRSGKPCGLCSYKQSCGYGGQKKCNASPFTWVIHASLAFVGTRDLCCYSATHLGVSRKSFQTLKTLLLSNELG